MTALYLERFMNYGITPEELRAGRPIIGIAQSGSDLNPCNRIHLELASRVRDGVRDAGGIPLEYPVHPIFENCRRPTAALDRNPKGMELEWIEATAQPQLEPPATQEIDDGCIFREPDRMLAEGDPLARVLLSQWNGVAMPNLGLLPAEVDALLLHLEAVSRRAAAPAR